MRQVEEIVDETEGTVGVGSQRSAVENDELHTCTWGPIPDGGGYHVRRTCGGKEQLVEVDQTELRWQWRGKSCDVAGHTDANQRFLPVSQHHPPTRHRPHPARNFNTSWTGPQYLLGVLLPGILTFKPVTLRFGVRARNHWWFDRPQKRLLFWLEVLSVLSATREAVDALEVAAGWLNVR